MSMGHYISQIFGNTIYNIQNVVVIANMKKRKHLRLRNAVATH